MATINLLPWREELREQRKKQFITLCFGDYNRIWGMVLF